MLMAALRLKPEGDSSGFFCSQLPDSILFWWVKIEI